MMYVCIYVSKKNDIEYDGNDNDDDGSDNNDDDDDDDDEETAKTNPREQSQLQLSIWRSLMQ